jgi:hypothetical protein
MGEIIEGNYGVFINKELALIHTRTKGNHNINRIKKPKERVNKPLSSGRGHGSTRD